MACPPAMRKMSRLVCRHHGHCQALGWLVSGQPPEGQLPAAPSNGGPTDKPRRPVMLRFFAGCLTALLIAGPAWAQEFPSRPITMIVGVAPGGTLDTLARDRKSVV